jgi:hypothetical protein
MRSGPVARACVLVIACGLALPPALSGVATAGFAQDDFLSYSQDDWGALSTPASQLLFDNFFALYPNGIELGIVGAGGNSAIFNNPEAVLEYLPAPGAPGAFEQDYQDQTTTTAGMFGGIGLALRIDVDFADAGVLAGSAGFPFGDLVLHDLVFDRGGGNIVPQTDFNGLTVRQYLATVETRLGGGPGPYSFDDLAFLTDFVTRSFQDGTPSAFAQDHLVVPEPSGALALAMVAVPALARGYRRRASAAA